jgi:hypothetical protein
MRSCIICTVPLTKYYLGDQLKERWALRGISRKGEIRNAYKILIGTPERKRPLGRPRNGWENIIKVHLKEIRCDGVDWINFVQDRVQWWALVNTVKNLAEKLPASYERDYSIKLSVQLCVTSANFCFFPWYLAYYTSTFFDPLTSVAIVTFFLWIL